MTARLNPYLTFNGNAREAIEFYQSAIGGDLDITTYGDLGAPSPELAGKIMHAALTTANGLTLMVSDIGPGMPAATAGTTITCSLSGDQGEGLEEAWAKLSDGGTVTMPFEKQMWGDEFGQCIDKFGVPWVVNVTQSK